MSTSILTFILSEEVVHKSFENYGLDLDTVTISYSTSAS